MTFDRSRLTTDEWEAVIGAEVRAARIDAQVIDPVPFVI